MKKDCKSEIYLCTCHGEGISVEKWDRDEIYMAFWHVGKWGSYPMSWKERIRWCLNILTKGEVWADEVIFTNKTAKKLGEYLIKIAK